MKTEKIISRTEEQCVNITANEIDSLRISNEVRNTVRVYDKGLIGVAGKIGKTDCDKLEKEAVKALDKGIAYPVTADEKNFIEIDSSKPIVAADKFVETVTKLVSRISSENPDFLFGNKVLLSSDEHIYDNSDGVKFRYRGNSIQASFVLKHKKSANIMDEIYSFENDCYDEDKIAGDINRLCRAYSEKLPQIKENKMLFICDLTPVNLFIEYFFADLYCNGASLLSGKMGEKIFDDKLGIVLDRNSARTLLLPFFDAEGAINKDYRAYLTKYGVMKNLITTKRTAAKYDVPNSGGAVSTYTSVPYPSAAGLDVIHTHDNMESILEGNKAVYISLTSGGNITPEGMISMPVQSAYLYRDKSLSGRLPEFTVTGNVFDIFGKGFKGAYSEGLFDFTGKQTHLVFEADAVNKVF